MCHLTDIENEFHFVLSSFLLGNMQYLKSEIHFLNMDDAQRLS